jgi:hypothetical protein
MRELNSHLRLHQLVYRDSECCIRCFGQRSQQSGLTEGKQHVCECGRRPSRQSRGICSERRRRPQQVALYPCRGWFVLPARPVNAPDNDRIQLPVLS